MVSNEKEKAKGARLLAKWMIAVVGLLCLVGIGVSVELTRIHILTHTDPEFHAICAVSEGVNCETVALSPYSVFAGLPVSVWGILGYSLMALLAIWGVTGLRLHPEWPLGGLLVFCAISMGVSIEMAYLSFMKIDSICLFCMASYAINAVCLILLLVAAFRGRGWCGLLDAVIADLKAFAARPVAPIVFAGSMAAGVAATEIAVDPYWERPLCDEECDLASGDDEKGHHWIGAEKPLLTIVEFSDYECPHCRLAHLRARELLNENGDVVRLVHRHLPLDRSCHPMMRREFHMHACKFAKAAECAAEQGKFWEMNDALFGIQAEVKSHDVDVDLLAVRVGIDRSVFQECMAGSEAKDRVKEDLAAAIEAGLRGTPTFFMKGEKYVGCIPKQAFVEALRQAKLKE